MKATQIIIGSFKAVCSNCEHVNFFDLSNREKSILKNTDSTKTITKNCMQCRKAIEISQIQEITK